MSKKLKTKYVGWAIDTNSDDGYLNQWFWRTPTHMEGHQISLFETRDRARQVIPQAKIAYPKATVRKVCIYVEQA